jgi:hypothetical protein
VSAKYKTKNIKTDVMEVFLATKNQSSAIIISSRNLRLMATRLYIVWLSGSLVCPLMKINSVINEFSEKASERMTISLSEGISLTEGTRKYATINMRIFKSTRKAEYFERGFNDRGHLIKSLTAKYIDAKTPMSESMIVKTGVCHPVSLSSFTPPQTATRIIPIIWNAKPEYLAKS